MPSGTKAAHPGFETQRRHHQKSKTVAPYKGHMSTNIFQKKPENLKTLECKFGADFLLFYC